MRRPRRGRRPLAVLPVLVLAAACSAPVGVAPARLDAVHRALTANAPSARAPRGFSLQVLQRLALRERFARDPAGALAELHRTLGPRGQESRVFALAELSFLHAEQGAGRPYHLGAAVYAHAVLFPGDEGRAPDTLDPRTRLAADLYNRGLTEGLASPDGQRVTLAAGPRALPFGELDVALDPAGLVWAGRRLDGFVAAARLEVRGLRHRDRQAGLGAPLAATPGPPAAGVTRPADRCVAPGLKVAMTAVLRLEAARRTLPAGRLRGVIELFASDAGRTAWVDGRESPLELETSAALASTLDGSTVWEVETRGFPQGDLRPGPGVGLHALAPYRPGRVPVVPVHGTASSPARRTGLVNEVENDPALAPQGQFWIFVYHTGNPILHSASLLREALARAVTELGPDASDPALRWMLVVGHSQGGLLTRLTVVDRGTRFWDNVSTTPLESLRSSEEARGLLRRSLFVAPLPFVTRVIFVAPPHRGSEVVGVLASRLRALVPWALALPLALLRTPAEVLAGTEDPLLRRTLRQGLPRSVDNMDPGHPFVLTLSQRPIASRVGVHSIVAVRDDGPPGTGSDGVVGYRTAHLDGVASERVVRSSHPVRAHPEAIEEIRRILRLHVGATPG